MDRGELEKLLRLWGVTFGREHRSDDWDEPVSPYPQPLVQALEFAPGKRDKRTAQHRDGRSRRMLIGAAAGIQGKLAPSWSTDPVTGQQTKGAARTWQPNPVADAVESAWHDLYRLDRIQAVCIRVEYCKFGPQRLKCELAAEILREQLKLRRYRLELDYARSWMHGRLVGKIAA